MAEIEYGIWSKRNANVTRYLVLDGNGRYSSLVSCTHLKKTKLNNKYCNRNTCLHLYQHKQQIVDRRYTSVFLHMYFGILTSTSYVYTRALGTIAIGI